MMPAANPANCRQPTVLCSWTKVLVLALQSRGFQTDGIVIAAGLDPASFANPDARFPLACTTRLWRAAVDLVGDETIGLWVAKYSSQTTFHALGYAFMASRTLLEAMHRVVRFNGMVSDAAQVELLSEGPSYRVQWQVPPGQFGPADEAMEAILSLIIRSCRKIRGYEFAPIKVELKRPEPAAAQAYRDFFRCETVFGAPHHALAFQRDQLEEELLWANEELARSNDRVVEEYLTRLEVGSVATRLRALLTRELSAGIKSHEHYAKVLGMSGRSLQRKLKQEGTSFQQVLNETRCELAKSYLQQSDRQSLTEVAFLLGFSDTSSFSRAFRRWTKVAPSAYGSP
jgi:AraC-like DNA-binding protein